MVITYQRPKLHPKQEAFVNDPSRFSWCEAGTKAGKTIGCIIWLHEQVIQSIPQSNFWWIAPYYTTAKIAFVRWWQFIPEQIKKQFSKNETELSITYPSGQRVFFKSGEKPDTLYGEDVRAVVLDEASRMRVEVWHAVISVLTATGGKAKIIGNVEDTGKWFYRMAHTAKERGEGYHKLISADNPYISAQVIAHAKSTLPEPIFNALYLAIPTDQYSSFRIINSQDVIASSIPMLAARNPYYVGIDIGLGAPDKTSVWCADQEGNIWKETELSIYDEMQQVDALIPLVRRVEAIGGHICLDVTGIGHGVVSRLRELSNNQTIIAVNFGGSANDKEKFKNKRAEMYWKARLGFQSKQYKIVVTDELMEEIESTFYMPEENKIRIEPKDNIKERLGRSPNDLDAVVLLFEAMTCSTGLMYGFVG